MRGDNCWIFSVFEFFLLLINEQNLVQLLRLRTDIWVWYKTQASDYLITTARGISKARRNE